MISLNRFSYFRSTLLKETLISNWVFKLSIVSHSQCYIFILFLGDFLITPIFFFLKTLDWKLWSWNNHSALGKWSAHFSHSPCRMDFILVKSGFWLRPVQYFSDLNELYSFFIALKVFIFNFIPNASAFPLLLISPISSIFALF